MPQRTLNRTFAPDLAQRLVKIVIIVLLVSAPLVNFGEIATLIAGRRVTFNNFTTPVAFKLIKDVGIITLGLLAAWLTLRAARHGGLHPAQRKTLPLFGLVLAAMGLSAAWTLIANPQPLPDRVALMLAGGRWLAPLVLAWLLIGWVDESFLRTVALAAAALFLAAFVFQLYLAFRTAVGSSFNAFGLPSRVSGIFLLPNTASFYACVAAFLSYYYLKGSPLRWPVIALAPLSVWFTASGGGLIALGAMLLLIPFGKRWLTVRLLLVPILLVVTLANLGRITARDDVLQESGQGRARLFLSAARESGLVSNRFGAGTNSGVLLRSVGLDTQSQITDSFYTSTLTNSGFLGLTAMLLALAALFVVATRYAYATGRTEPLVFLTIYALYGVSSSVTEAFPMNVLFAVWVAAILPRLLAPHTPLPVAPVESRRARRMEFAYLGVVGVVGLGFALPEIIYEMQLTRARVAVALLSPNLPESDFNAAAKGVLAELPNIATWQPQRPNVADVAIDVAHRYADRGDWLSAVKTTLAARAAKPNERQIVLGAGDLYRRLNIAYVQDETIATRLLNGGLSFHDFIELGHFSAAIGHEPVAARWYEIAQAMGLPNNQPSRDLWLRLGYVYFASNDYERALDAFAQMRAAPPGPPIAEGTGKTYPAPRDLGNTADLFTAGPCLAAGRAERVADRAASDGWYVIRMGDLAWLQARWSDALACYMLNEYIATYQPVVPTTPDLEFRVASAAALAQAADAGQRLGALANTLPGFAVHELGPNAIADIGGASLARVVAPTEFASFDRTSLQTALAASKKPFRNAEQCLALVQLNQDGTVDIAAKLGDLLAGARATISVDLIADPTAQVASPSSGQMSLSLQARLSKGYHLVGVAVEAADPKCESQFVGLRLNAE